MAYSYKHQYTDARSVTKEGKGEGWHNARALDHQYRNYLKDQERLFRHFINIYAYEQAGVKQAGIKKAQDELVKLDVRPQFDGIEVSPELDLALDAFLKWTESGCPEQ